MNDHLHKLSDTAVLSQYFFYKAVLAQPWGYKKFPNAGERLQKLSDIIDQRIPASHVEEIQKIHQRINSKP